MVASTNRTGLSGKKVFHNLHLKCFDCRTYMQKRIMKRKTILFSRHTVNIMEIKYEQSFLNTTILLLFMVIYSLLEKVEDFEQSFDPFHDNCMHDLSSTESMSIVQV